MKVFELFGEVGLKDGDVKTKLDELDKKAEGTGSRMDKLKGIAGGAGKAIASGIAVGVTAMAGMVMATTAAGDEIDKHSQKLGVTAEAYQEWNYILGQNGIEMSAMDKAMKQTNINISNTGDETSKASMAYAELGIEVENANGTMKTSEEIFDETIAGLQGIDDEATRNGLAMDLLGSRYAEFNPLLNATAEETDALKQNIHDMGGVMSQDSVDAAAKFNDSMDDLKKSLGGAAMSIGAELMPMFQSLADWVLDHMPEIQAFIKKAFEVIGAAVKVVVAIFQNFLIPVFSVLFDFVTMNFPIIQAVIEGVFGAIKFVWEKVLKPVLTAIIDVFTTIVDFVKEKFAPIQQVFETVFEGIGNAVEKVTGFFTKFTDGIKSAWDWLTKWNREEVKDKKTKGGFFGRGKAVDGSNRDGLSYVPFDGYVSELHQGERVLTRSENRDYSQGGGNLANEIVRALLDAGITKPATIVLDGKAVGKGLIDVIDNGLSKNNKKTQLGRGQLV